MLWRSKNSFLKHIRQEDKDWIIQNFTWLIENFGYQHVSNFQNFSINENNIPELKNKITFSLDDVKNRICGFLEIPTQHVQLKSSEFTEQYTLVKLQIEPSGYIIIFNENITDRKQLSLLLIIWLIRIQLHEKGVLYTSDEDINIFLITTLFFLGFGEDFSTYYLYDYTSILPKGEKVPFYFLAYLLAFIHVLSEHEVSIDAINLKHKSFIKVYEGAKEDIKNNPTISISGMQEFGKMLSKHQEAIAQYDKGMYELAISLTQECLISFPDNILFLSSLAHFYNKNRDFKNAEKSALKVLKKDPFHLDGQNELAYSFISQNELQKGLQVLNNISEEFKNEYTFLYHGIYCASKNDLENALTYFDKASSLNNKTELLHHHIGLVHLESQNFDLALKSFKYSLKLNEKESIPFIEIINKK